MPPQKIAATKLSPTAYDRWWRDRIEKEEGKAGAEERTAAKTSTIKLNTLGGVQEILIAGDHLMGAGAMVKPRKNAPADGTQAEDGTQGARSKAGSLATVRTQRGAGAGRAGSVAASGASYPKTPNLSQAGESVTSTVIMGRLQRLEQELVRERVRREAAEREMTDLMMAATRLTPPPTARV